MESNLIHLNKKKGDLYILIGTISKIFSDKENNSFKYKFPLH